MCIPQEVVVEPSNGDNIQGVRGKFKDQSTGCKVLLVQQEQRWEFHVRNSKTMWNIAIGPHGAGNAGFLVGVEGGLVGKVNGETKTETFTGFGTCAHVEL